MSKSKIVEQVASNNGYKCIDQEVVNTQVISDFNGIPATGNVLDELLDEPEEFKKVFRETLQVRVDDLSERAKKLGILQPLDLTLGNISSSYSVTPEVIEKFSKISMETLK